MKQKHIATVKMLVAWHSG